MTWALFAFAGLFVVGLLVFAWLCALAASEQERERRR